MSNGIGDKKMARRHNDELLFVSMTIPAIHLAMGNKKKTTIIILG